MWAYTHMHMARDVLILHFSIHACILCVMYTGIYVLYLCACACYTSTYVHVLHAGTGKVVGTAAVCCC